MTSMYRPAASPAPHCIIDVKQSTHIPSAPAFIPLVPCEPREVTSDRRFRCLWLIAVMLFSGTLLAEPPTRLRVIDKSGENRQRVGLGFSMPDTIADLAADEGASGPSGPEVVQILPGGPADLAGVRVGDHVIRLDLKRIRTATEVQEVRKDLEVGRPIKIAVRRQNLETGEWATQTLDITPISTEAIEDLKFKEFERRRDEQAKADEMREQGLEKQLLAKAERDREAKEKAEAIRRAEQANADVIRQAERAKADAQCKTETAREENRIRLMLLRPPLEIEGATLERDILNAPALGLRVKNNRQQVVEAYEVTVKCFTKFGDPVKSLLGTNVFEGIAQSEVAADSVGDSTWRLTLHETTGLAKVRIERVKLADGTVWKPAGETEGWVEVKQK